MNSKAGARDSLDDLFKQKTARRVILVLVFGAGALLAHSLLAFLLSMAATTATAESLARRLKKRVPGVSWTLAVNMTAWAILVVLLACLWIWGGQGASIVTDGVRELPAIWADLLSVPAVRSAVEWWPGKPPGEIVAEHAGVWLFWASQAARAVVLALIGAIVATIYLVERGERRPEADDKTMTGTLMRWIRYSMDGVKVMIRTQLLVSLVNAILTLPILLFLGIPRAVTLTLLVFIAGLVPVLGNLFSGGTLALIAYTRLGMQGVVTVTILTALLHKIEAYFINPRIADRHVHIGNTGIILSLLIWERLAGVGGLFISLPFLYLCQMVRAEWRAEDERLEPGTAKE